MPTDLYVHPLMLRLGPLAAAIVSDAFDRRTRESRRDLRPDEAYVREVLITAGHLIGLCDQLALAVQALSGYRARPGSSTTRLDYIVYHIENHVIRFVAAADRTLQFANALFRLGVPEHACRRDVIAFNEYVKSTKVARSLDQIDKLVAPHRQTRNVVVHRRRHSDEAIDRLAPYYLLATSSPCADEFVLRVSPLYRRLTDETVAKKKRELGRADDSLVALVSGLFDAALPLFDAIRRQWAGPSGPTTA